MTGDLGDELRALAEEGARRRQGLMPPPDVARAVRRRRSVRGGLWAAGTTGGIAVIAAAAAPSVLETTNEVEPTPVPSVMDTVIDHATVAFDDAAGMGWFATAGNGAPEECGGPLPAPVASTGDFTATFEPPESTVFTLDGGEDGSPMAAEMTYRGTDDVPAISEPVTAMFARDGVVVGYGVGYDDQELTTWRTGGSISHTWDSTAWATPCPGDDGAAATQDLPAGEYQVVWTMRVHASQEANAQMDLADEGFVVPLASVLEIYREGSYDCQRASEWGVEVPITCEPDALFGTVIDPEAGTVTFPYRASAYTRDVDATLVSEPLSVTVESSPSRQWWTQFEEEHPDYEPGTPVGCGDEIRPSSSDVALGWTVGWDEIVADTRTEASAWAWNADWTHLAISLPQSTRVWLLDREDVMYEVEDGIQAGSSVEVVVGWADITLPATLDLVRYDGPTDFDLAIEEVEWCDGGPPSDGVTPGGVIIDPHQATDATGASQTVLDPITVRWGLEW